MAAGKDLGHEPDGHEPERHEPGEHEPDPAGADQLGADGPGVAGSGPQRPDADRPEFDPTGADLPDLDVPDLPDLPELDVVVPDDLRELDREVQAYQRERRRERRGALARRFVPGLSRLGPYGVLAPVIAAVLVVTAVLGSMVSLLNPRATAPSAGSGRAGSATGAGTGDTRTTMAPENGVGRPLPSASVSVDGGATALAGLRSAVVVAVPAGCACQEAVDAVTSVARQAGVRVYLSGVTGEVSGLASHEGSYPHLLAGAVASLDRTYAPHGLSAVLVGRDGRVTRVERDLTAERSVTADQVAALLATPSP